MDTTLAIPQTIGTTYGIKNDGVIIGEVSHENFNSEAYYSFAHEVLYGIQENNDSPVTPTYTWTDLTAKLNGKIATPIFTPIDPSNAFQKLFLAVDNGISGFAFNVTTAGLGTFTVQAYYNSPTGYIPIPSVTFSPNFLQTVGTHFVNFIAPTDWATDYIGFPTPLERWLVLQITPSTTITTQPVLTGAWSLSGAISKVTHTDVNPPFTNPYDADLLPGNGDSLYLVSTQNPYGMVITYKNALTEGNVSYQYSKTDGTYAPLTVLSDTSAGFTVQNSQTYQKNNLTAAGTNSDSSTNNGILENGYVFGTVSSLPLTPGDKISIGLSETQSGSFLYELSVIYSSGAAVYEIFNNAVSVFTSTLVPHAGDVMSILRYKEKIYFQVNGVNIYPAGVPFTNTNLLYGRVLASDSGFVLNDFILADWSTRKVIPQSLTFNNTNFTASTSSNTEVFPAHYYIQFVPPADFVSVSSLLSKTGVAGFGLQILYVFTGSLPANNIVLMDQKVLTTNSTNNVFFPNGTQTSLKIVNLSIMNPENMTATQEFLLIINNLVGQTYRTVSFISTDPDINIFSQAVATTGMTGIIIVQVSGDEILTVGTPSQFYLGT